VESEIEGRKSLAVEDAEDGIIRRPCATFPLIESVDGKGAPLGLAEGMEAGRGSDESELRGDDDMGDIEDDFSCSWPSTGTGNGMFICVGWLLGTPCDLRAWAITA